MQRIPCLILAIAAVGILSGCGDPAPSTQLAPDQKPLDASKLTPEQVNQMLKNDHGVESDRNPTAAPKAKDAAGQPSGVPQGR